MADEADLAFDAEQRHLRYALAAHSHSHKDLPHPTGSCHFCGNTEGLENRLFCDRDCAEDWEYERTLRRKVGAAPLH